MMAAYIISDVRVQDSAAIEVYRRPAAASIAQYSGRYLVRGGGPRSGAQPEFDPRRRGGLARKTHEPKRS